MNDPKTQERLPDPINARVEITLANFAESASIFVHAPNKTGEHVTFKQIQEAIDKAGVVYGIDEMILRNIVGNRSYGKKTVFANCKKPVRGQDAKVEYFFETNETKPNSFKEDEKGFVDYKDLGGIRNIYKGTVVGSIVKETEGTQGINVKKQPIDAVKGKSAEGHVSENIIISEDGTQLLAKEDGNLIFQGGKFFIQPIIHINGDVDISVGNINFVGGVIVSGDVKDNFSVKSEKDIAVYGGAYGAKLSATGKIVVKKGVVGSELTSGSDVEIEFAEKTTINCKGVLKSSNIIFSNVYCESDIFVNTGTGIIMGGQVISTNNIYANVLGTKSYVATKIVVGGNAVLSQEKQALTQHLEKLETEESKCTKIIEYLNIKKQELGKLPDDKEEVKLSVEATIMDLTKQKEECLARISEIDEYLQTKQNFKIECTREIYPGVNLTINDMMVTVKDTYKRCLVRMVDKEIEFCQL